MHSFKSTIVWRSNSRKRGTQTRARLLPWKTFFVLALSIFWVQVVVAQTQQAATESQLQAPVGTNTFCLELAGPLGSAERAAFDAAAGPQLFAICDPSGAPGSAGGGAATGNTGTTAPTEAAAERLLKLRRENGEKDPADANIELLPGLNVWFTGQGEKLDRDVTTFEDGYDSDRWGATVGMDARFNNWFLAGVAFNYNRWQGDFESGGGFDVDSYGPVLYASVTPMKNLFADLSLGYSKQSGDRSRFTFFKKDVVIPETFGGKVNGDINADEYKVRAVLGYDHPIRNFTVGPRLGGDYSYADIDGFRESGDTGLELSYNDDSVKSLKSIVGMVATAAFSMDFGVLSAQLNADWTHEFENDQRNISVQFVQDGRAVPKTFSFETESPDRDAFHLGGGVVAVLPNGVQTFANFQALLGHDFLDNYMGTIGMRIEL